MTELHLSDYLQNCRNYYLKPGFLYVAEQATAMRTVLGSCVSVCLHDTRLRYGGINHYLLPEPTNEQATPRYGKPAILALMATFLEFGSRQTDLVAQIVGGGGMPGHSASQAIGQANVQIARQMLHHYGIPVISEDVGGLLGRKVLFMSELNQLMVFKLEKIRTMDYFDYNDQRRLEYESDD